MEIAFGFALGILISSAVVFLAWLAVALWNRRSLIGERMFFIIAIGLGVVMPTGLVLFLLWS
jgi:hypothetical protein